MNVKHLLVLSLVLFVSLSVVIAADKEKTKSLIETVLGKIIDNHEKNVAKANNKYQKSIAPIVDKYNKRRIASIKRTNIQTINKLNNLVKEANRKKEILSVEIIKKQIETIKKNNKSLENVPSVNRMWRIEYKDHHYLAILAPVTWHEAKKICEKMGGYLVCIETKEEMDFLDKIAKDWFWVGGTRDHKLKDWRWISGRSIDKTLWGDNQPSNAAGELYSTLWGGNGLFDVSSKHQRVRGFICEWD